MKMGARVKKMTLTCREANGLFFNAGGVSNEVISAYLRGAVHVEDLRVVDLRRDGEHVVLYVESATFPDLGCCYIKNAAEVDQFPEWLVVERGAR